MPESSPDLAAFCQLYKHRPPIAQSYPAVDDEVAATEALVAWTEQLLAVAPLDAPAGELNAQRVSFGAMARLMRRTGSNDPDELISVATPEELAALTAVMAHSSPENDLGRWVDQNCP